MLTASKLVSSRKRVQLTKKSRPYVYRAVLFTLLFSTLLLIAYAKASRIELVIIVLGTFLLLGVQLSFTGMLSTIYYENEVFLIKPVYKKSYVVPFNAVRYVRTFSLFGFKMSKLKFKIDGKKRCYISLGRSYKLKANNIQITDVIKEIKEKKANHKPGSVTA